MTNDSGHESTAMSLESNQGEGEDVLKKTEEETKNSILAIAEDEDSLLEEGSDFFWLLQNVVWNAVKSLFIIFVLLGIIWLVWSKSPASNNERSGAAEISQEKKNVVIEESVEKKENPKVIQTTPRPTKNNTVPFVSSSSENVISINTELGNIAKKTADWHSFIDKKQMFTEEKSLSEAFFWMRDVESIYDIPLPAHFEGGNYSEKKDKINGFLNQVSYLLTESLRIRSQVYEKKQIFAAEASESEALFLQTTNEINTRVQQKQASQIPLLIQQKSEHSKNFSANKTEDEIRQTVLLTMERYDKSLRSLYEVVFANQEAIAHDIQVVNFPSDPFSRVITPAQWRGN